MKYHIAICDDEQSEIIYIKSLVAAWAGQNGNTVIIKEFKSAEAFLFDYADHKDYDILLLDIKMKNISGVELAKTIRKENVSIQIVFITGYPDFIAEGYEVAALHYLMKPVTGEKLSEVLMRACDNLGRDERAVLFHVDGELMRIPANKILFAEAFAHVVLIHTKDGSFEVKMPISEAERFLGDEFVRCHRSYIVSLKDIRRITKNSVILDSGKEIPLARSAYGKVNQAFISYYRLEERKNKHENI